MMSAVLPIPPPPPAVVDRPEALMKPVMSSARKPGGTWEEAALVAPTVMSGEPS